MGDQMTAPDLAVGTPPSPRGHRRSGAVARQWCYRILVRHPRGGVTSGPIVVAPTEEIAMARFRECLNAIEPVQARRLHATNFHHGAKPLEVYELVDLMVDRRRAVA